MSSGRPTNRIVATPAPFHKSGGYTATLGDMECREQIARFEEHLFGVPRLGAEHIAIGMGSTQLTHDLFRTLLDPGDTVMLLDPTYANYEGQLAFAVPGVKIVRLRVLDPQTLVVSAGNRSRRHRARVLAAVRRASPAHGAVRRARQSDEPGRAAGARRRDAAKAPPRPARGWRSTSPTSASTSRRRRRITRGRRPIIRTSSASTRTRSGRAGWAGGSAGSKRPRRSSKRSSACSSAASSAPTRCRR